MRPAEEMSATERAVRATLTGLDTAFAARDFDRVLDYYTADAVLYLPGKPAIVGHAAIHVGEQRQGGRSQRASVDETLELREHRIHQRRMEGVRNFEPHCAPSRRRSPTFDLLDVPLGTGHDGVSGTVDGGQCQAGAKPR